MLLTREEIPSNKRYDFISQLVKSGYYLLLEKGVEYGKYKNET